MVPSLPERICDVSGAAQSGRHGRDHGGQNEFETKRRCAARPAGLSLEPPPHVLISASVSTRSRLFSFRHAVRDRRSVVVTSLRPFVPGCRAHLNIVWGCSGFGLAPTGAVSAIMSSRSAASSGVIELAGRCPSAGGASSGSPHRFSKSSCRVFLPAGPFAYSEMYLSQSWLNVSSSERTKRWRSWRCSARGSLSFADQLPMVGDPVARAGQVESRIGPQRERHGFREQGRPVFEQEAL